MDTAEVVEDERLVEATHVGDRSRTRTGKPVRLERLERSLGDLQLRPSQRGSTFRRWLSVV